MHAFFVFGSANFQDLLPVLFESLKQKESSWLCFFDCFSKKRQLASYTKEEVENFIYEKCDELCYKRPAIDFFRVDEKSRYESLYDSYLPSHVFVQEINPKYPIWYPRADKSKVIHFAWWDESKHLNNPLISVDVSILKRAEDIKYGYEKYNTAYFGNLRLDHLKYASKKTRKKRCFIPETYLRMSSKYRNDSMQIVDFIDNLIPFLRKNEFEIVWKKREKGFPAENWASPLDFCNEKPDIIIEKDLNFPSSLVGFAYDSDICMVINDCFAFFDMVTVNTNCCILTTHGGRKHKIDDFFIEDYSDEIIDMKNENGWNLLSERLARTNKFVYSTSNISGEILNYVRNIK